MSNGHEIQGDQKVIVSLIITKQSHVHRDFLSPSISLSMFVIMYLFNS